MKTLLTFVLLNFSHVAMPQADVRRAIDIFFEGFHARDTVKMQSVMDKSMVLHSVADGKNGVKLLVETPQEFCRSIATLPQEIAFEEKILSCTIQTDGPMAHAWMPYEFYVNGKLSHTGVNSFQLFCDATGWKIVYCIDTRRKP